MSDGTALAMRITATTVAVVCVTILIALVGGAPLGGWASAHLGVLGLLLAAGAATARMRNQEGRALIRAILAIGSMFFLYTSLGYVAFQAIPWNGDPAVRAIDRLLFLGSEPVVIVSDLVAGREGVVELFAFFYSAFIPFIYISIFLGLAGRPGRIREVFVLAVAGVYAVSFLGYLFVPARGPVVEMVDVLNDPLTGGYFYNLVLRSIEAFGGPHGAFPSLHVGASAVMMLVDLRHGDVLRGLIYIPLLVAICGATIVLRYHYVIDVVVGLGLAYLAVRFAEHRLIREGSA